MERRYGRQVRRYRTELNREKKKMPPERLILLQSAFCAIALAAGIITACGGFGSAFKGRVRAVLYESDSASELQKNLTYAAKAARSGAIKTAEAINRGVELCEKKFGVEKASDGKSSVKAKAENKKSEDEKSDGKTAERKSDSSGGEPEPAKPSDKEPTVFQIPTQGEISSVFGSRVHPISGETTVHTGIDIAAPNGQAVVSAVAGTVESTGEDSANGKYVTVRHTESLVTVYAHLSEVSTAAGTAVAAGGKIGAVGSSGVSTGPHLHFEVKVNGESVNPESYITLPHREGV